MAHDCSVHYWRASGEVTHGAWGEAMWVPLIGWDTRERESEKSPQSSPRMALKAFSAHQDWGPRLYYVGLRGTLIQTRTGLIQ